jgi:hypothetical protein
MVDLAALRMCNGKIARAQAFLSRDEALEAVGLSDPPPQDA